jgi:hypothetical protein
LKSAIIISNLFTLLILWVLKGPVIILPIEKERIFSLLFGNGRIDSILIRISSEHVMIGKSEKFLVVSDHEHFVLFVYPPVVLFPLLVINVNHFREELVLVRLVIRNVIIESELQSIFFLLGCCVSKEVSFDYFSKIL